MFITIRCNVIVPIQVHDTVEVTDRATHGMKQINTAGCTHKAATRAFVVPLKCLTMSQSEQQKRAVVLGREKIYQLSCPLFQKQQVQLLRGRSHPGNKTQRAWITACF